MAAIAAGVVIAALMAGFAWWSDPGVVDDDEATRLVSTHNGSLVKQLEKQSWLAPLPGGLAVGTGFRF